MIPEEDRSSSGPEELKPTQTQESLPRSFRDPLLYESQDSQISGLTEFRIQNLSQKLFCCPMSSTVCATHSSCQQRKGSDAQQSLLSGVMTPSLMSVGPGI